MDFGSPYRKSRALRAVDRCAYVAVGLAGLAILGVAVYRLYEHFWR